MLKKLGQELSSHDVRTTFADARFPAPFAEGLEFSSPARGTWNIVHTGFLIPEAHEIFVCARGCLRGVVLTAAEANALSRYSAIEICEENILDGSMEKLMIEGVADVLRKLPYRPRAVLLYISCQHFFMAYDQAHVFSELRARFPDIRFADCYMIPTLRKSGITPDQKMRIQLYSMLEPQAPTNSSAKAATEPKPVPKNINHIGSNLPIHPYSELLPWLLANGIRLTSLHDCRTFDEYLAMASASANVYYEPLASMAARDLEKRLRQEAIYLPFVFDREGLCENYQMLAEKLSIPLPDTRPFEEAAKQALRHAKNVIGDTPIVVDYTFTFRILNFTRMLLSHGFHVTEVYADSFLPEEEADFLWIREHFPKIAIWSTNRPKMRFAERGRGNAETSCRLLAIGQKAAYFTSTDYFVNVAESGGYYGFGGIREIARLMAEAFTKKKDARDLIQRKGWLCPSCL